MDAFFDKSLLYYLMGFTQCAKVIRRQLGPKVDDTDIIERDQSMSRRQYM